MRILIDLTSLADNFTGIERYAASLSLELIKYKEYDYIILFKEKIHPLFSDLTSLNNIELIVLSKCNKFFFMQFKLPYIIYKLKADYYLFLAFPVPILLFKKNLISTIHDLTCWDYPETMKGIMSLYFKISHIIAIKKCKAIITISNFSKNRIMDKLKYNKDKILTIFCGVDDKFLNYIYNEDKFQETIIKYNIPSEYILSLSTMEPRKNLKLLISSFRDLVINEGLDYPLVLAGRKGWKISDLLDGIENSVRDKIFFTGFVDDSDLPFIYGGSKVFVFPSLYEGFGMPPLEALACGANIVSSNSSSLPEVLGKAALYFESNNKEDLKNAIIGSIYYSNTKEDSYIKKCQVSLFKWNIEASKLLVQLENLNKVK